MSLWGPVLDIVGSVFGNKQENKANRAEMMLADLLTDQNATVANRRNNESMAAADKLADRNFSVQNAANDKDRLQTQQFNAAEAVKANMFSAGQADKANAFSAGESTLAYERSQATDLRNRGWALDDLAQVKADLANRFVDDRAAAEKAGFNPFAVATGQMVPSPAGGIGASSFASASGVAAMGMPATSPSPAGGFMMPGSTPMSYGATVIASPIASNAAIMGAVSEFGREVTGQNAIGRANENMQNELLRIELDQARARPTLAVVPPSFSSREPTRGSTARVQLPAGVGTMQPSVDVVGSAAWRPGYPEPQNRVGSFGDATRPVDRVPTSNQGGMIEVENDWTGGAVYIPGSDGEFMGLGEAMVGAVVGLPQVLNNYGERAMGSFVDYMGAGWSRGRAENAGASRSFFPSLFAPPRQGGGGYF